MYEPSWCHSADVQGLGPTADMCVRLCSHFSSQPTGVPPICSRLSRAPSSSLRCHQSTDGYSTSRFIAPNPLSAVHVRHTPTFNLHCPGGEFDTSTGKGYAAFKVIRDPILVTQPDGQTSRDEKLEKTAYEGAGRQFADMVLYFCKALPNTHQTARSDFLITASIMCLFTCVAAWRHNLPCTP